MLYMPTLALPAVLREICTAAAKGRWPARAVVIADLAILNGFGAGQIAALDCGDVDIVAGLIRRVRRERAWWMPLSCSNTTLWKELLGSSQPSAPLLVSRTGLRLSRVDVWRVLRDLGVQAQLKKPLNTRRTRKVFGYVLGRRNDQPAEAIAAALGNRGLEGIRDYLPAPKWADFPRL